MSQRSVEQVIGRLATDEAFRERFAGSREATLAQAIANGLELTPIERRALLGVDICACEQFAGHLDPRIQKISFRRTES